MDSLSVVGPSHEYIVPTKYIKTVDDMTLWQNSIAYHEYLGFILAIAESIKGKTLKFKGLPISSTIENMVEVIDKLDKLIDDTPPIEQPQRFGNQAFRQWLEKVKVESFKLISDVVPKDLHRCLAEVLGYFMESFGNSIRIDYGTGHEISFLMFLCCLFKVGVFTEGDKEYVALRIFKRYLDLVRKLQQTYRMEPAGSHGVWSLDDYQFVPFIWGAAQLENHPKLEPCSFLQPKIIAAFSDEYMFFGCIQYINQVKTGPFSEHSNQLWGVSAVPTWNRVFKGLIKMYKADVLGKFPVAQHIIFGSLLPLKAFVPPKLTVEKGYMGMSTPPPSKTDTSPDVQ